MQLQQFFFKFCSKAEFHDCFVSLAFDFTVPIRGLLYYLRDNQALLQYKIAFVAGEDKSYYYSTVISKFRPESQESQL